MNSLVNTFRGIAVTAILLLGPTHQASACACCSDPGSYSLSTHKLPVYHVDQINEVGFAPKALLFLVDGPERKSK